MWVPYEPVGCGSMLVAIAIIAVFAGAFLFAISAALVAPGILVTTLLFNLLSKKFISNDLWTSSVVFSIIIGGLIWYFYREKVTKFYSIMVLIIILFMGFYNTYINHDNAVMFTLNAMYSGNAITTTATTNAAIISDNVNLRKAPTKTASIISTLKENDNVIITKESGEWFYIRIISTGQEGWVFKQYVRN